MKPFALVLTAQLVLCLSAGSVAADEWNCTSSFSHFWYEIDTKKQAVLHGGGLVPAVFGQETNGFVVEEATDPGILFSALWEEDTEAEYLITGTRERLVLLSTSATEAKLLATVEWLDASGKTAKLTTEQAEDQAPPGMTPGVWMYDCNKEIN